MNRRNRIVMLTVALAAVLWLRLPGTATAAELGSRHGAAATSVRDCTDCPEMVRIPGGPFRMGDLSGNGYRDERPVHQVFVRPFWAGKYEVTLDEWAACVAAGGCEAIAENKVQARGRHPVTGMRWQATQQYVKWLSETTGQQYRLLSESEWEYAARAGSTSEYAWGDTASHDLANYGSEDCCEGLAQDRDQWTRSSPVGSFEANAWGLHDVHGNVWEWTADCRHDSYQGAPADERAWTEGGDCSKRMVRGGAWLSQSRELRMANRHAAEDSAATALLGFRVARTD